MLELMRLPKMRESKGDDGSRADLLQESMSACDGAMRRGREVPRKLSERCDRSRKGVRRQRSDGGTQVFIGREEEDEEEEGVGSVRVRLANLHDQNEAGPRAE